MNETLTLFFSGSVGGMLGWIFFGGLWWTIRKGVLSPQPAIWFLGSLLVRMSITLVGFYLVGDGRWERLVACLAGFIVARLLVSYLTRLPLPSHFAPTPEGGHAP
jgi:F1F0 ATPase subunit 2